MQIRHGEVLKAILGEADPEARTRSMFLAALSRDPSPSELQRFTDFLRQHAEAGPEQAYWTLLQTAEFLMRH